MSTAQSSTYRSREATRHSTPANHNEHVVHFYRDDAALIRELASYVGLALARGASAIIIATARHREQLTLLLEDPGIPCWAVASRRPLRFIGRQPDAGEFHG